MITRDILVVAIVMTLAVSSSVSAQSSSVECADDDIKCHVDRLPVTDVNLIRQENTSISSSMVWMLAISMTFDQGVAC